MWASIVGIATDLLGKIIGPLIDVWNRMRAERTARNLGRAEQSNLGLTETVKRTQDANQARSGVAGLTDDQLDDELRGKPPHNRR